MCLFHFDIYILYSFLFYYRIAVNRGRGTYLFGRYVVLLNVLRCQLTYQGQAETNAEAWFNIALRPRKPEGSLGRTAQDGHLDSHTAPEL